MGLGSTAKTLQRVADMADDVYSRLNDVRNRLEKLHTTVDRTDERVARLEAELAEQRAILDAIAEQEGVDAESVTAEVHIEEAERGDETAAAEADDEAVTGESGPPAVDRD